MRAFFQFVAFAVVCFTPRPSVAQSLPPAADPGDCPEEVLLRGDPGLLQHLAPLAAELRDRCMELEVHRTAGALWVRARQGRRVAERTLEDEAELLAWVESWLEATPQRPRATQQVFQPPVQATDDEVPDRVRWAPAVREPRQRRWTLGAVGLAGVDTEAAVRLGGQLRGLWRFRERGWLGAMVQLGSGIGAQGPGRDVRLGLRFGVRNPAPQSGRGLELRASIGGGYYAAVASAVHEEQRRVESFQGIFAELQIEVAIPLGERFSGVLGVQGTWSSVAAGSGEEAVPLPSVSGALSFGLEVDLGARL